jgi:hypothetical protein
MELLVGNLMWYGVKGAMYLTYKHFQANELEGQKRWVWRHTMRTAIGYIEISGTKASISKDTRALACTCKQAAHMVAKYGLERPEIPDETQTLAANNVHVGADRVITTETKSLKPSKGRYFMESGDSEADRASPKGLQPQEEASLRSTPLTSPLPLSSSLQFVARSVTHINKYQNRLVRAAKEIGDAMTPSGKFGQKYTTSDNEASPQYNITELSVIKTSTGEESIQQLPAKIEKKNRSGNTRLRRRHTGGQVRAGYGAQRVSRGKENCHEQAKDGDDSESGTVKLRSKKRQRETALMAELEGNISSNSGCKPIISVGSMGLTKEFLTTTATSESSVSDRVRMRRRKRTKYS